MLGCSQEALLNYLKIILENKSHPLIKKKKKSWEDCTKLQQSISHLCIWRGKSPRGRCKSSLFIQNALIYEKKRYSNCWQKQTLATCSVCSYWVWIKVRIFCLKTLPCALLEALMTGDEPSLLFQWCQVQWHLRTPVTSVSLRVL